MTTPDGPILSDEEVAALWAEHDLLSAERNRIDARDSEILAAIHASGEAKVRAIRDMQAALAATETTTGELT